MVDPADLRILDVNPVALKLTGQLREALVGSELSGVVQSESNTVDWLSAVRKTGTFHGKAGYRLGTSRPEGWIPVTVTVSHLHLAASPPLALLALRDVRKLHEVMRQAQRTAAELKRVLVSVQDCVWNAVVAADGRWQYAYLSPLIERLTGFPVERFLHRPAAFRDLVHPDDRRDYEQFAAELAAGRSTQADYRLCRADGSIRWISERVNCAATDGASGTQLFGILTDITERTHAEVKIRESEVRFRSVVQGSLQGILIHQDGRICYANAAIGACFTTIVRRS